MSRCKLCGVECSGEEEGAEFCSDSCYDDAVASDSAFDRETQGFDVEDEF